MGVGVVNKPSVKIHMDPADSESQEPSIRGRSWYLGVKPALTSGLSRTYGACPGPALSGS